MRTEQLGSLCYDVITLFLLLFILCSGGHVPCLHKKGDPTKTHQYNFN